MIVKRQIIMSLISLACLANKAYQCNQITWPTKSYLHESCSHGL